MSLGTRFLAGYQPRAWYPGSWLANCARNEKLKLKIESWSLVYMYIGAWVRGCVHTYYGYAISNNVISCERVNHVTYSTPHYPHDSVKEPLLGSSCPHPLRTSCGSCTYSPCTSCHCGRLLWSAECGGWNKGREGERERRRGVIERQWNKFTVKHFIFAYIHGQAGTAKIKYAKFPVWE